MPLGSLAQQDFSSGMWRSVARHLIPADGAWDLPNNLLDEDGSAYRRGGSAYLSTAAFGTSLRFMWDGFLGPGQRTLIANPDDFGALDALEAPVNLGGAGLSAPKKAVELAGVLFIGGGVLYGGSRKTADYSTGTVSVTQGSKTVTGAGTTWNTLVDAGMLLRIGSDRYYPVASIDSTTQLTLRDNYEGATAAGQAYTLAVLGTASAPYKTSDLYAVAAGRLFSMSSSRIDFTGFDANSLPSPHGFAADESYELPEGGQGIGMAGLGDRLLAFATNGLFMFSNLAFDFTDDAGNPQHRREHVSSELLLWSHEGIAQHHNALIAPCVDHIYLVDGVSSPEPITRSIADLYRDYVAAGHKTGLGVVFRSHYLLPVLSSANAIVDLLVCRLDRPTRSPIGTVYPWTRIPPDAFSGDVSALAVRTGGSASVRSPKLLAASMRATARVLDCTPFFGPDVAHAKEPDASVHEWKVETRDYATADGRNENTVRRLKVRYELEGDNPTIAADYADGTSDLTGLSLWDVALWDTGTWEDADAGEWQSLEGVAPEDYGGREPFPWHVNRRLRFVRYRLRTADAASRLILRTVESKIRVTGKD